MAHRDNRYTLPPMNHFEAALRVNTALTPCETIRKRSCVDRLHSPEQHRVKLPLPTLEPQVSTDGPDSAASSTSSSFFNSVVNLSPIGSPPAGFPTSHRSSQSSQHRKTSSLPSTQLVHRTSSASDENDAAYALTNLSKSGSPAGLEHRILPRPSISSQLGRIDAPPAPQSMLPLLATAATTWNAWTSQHQSTAYYNLSGSASNQVAHHSQGQAFQGQQVSRHASAFTGPSQLVALVSPSRKRKRSASTSTNDTVEDMIGTSASKRSQRAGCDFCDPPCGEVANFRSVISQFFGRNKNVTKLIPSHLIRVNCRKSYQRSKYAKDKEGVWYIHQAELLQELFIKVANWFNELNAAQGHTYQPLVWTIQVTKGVREKPAENPIDNAIQQGLTAHRLVGKNMKTIEVLQAIITLRNTIIPAIQNNPPSKDGLINEEQRKEFDRWLKAPNLGGIEFLPTGLEKAKKDGMPGIRAREKAELE